MAGRFPAALVELGPPSPQDYRYGAPMLRRVWAIVGRPAGLPELCVIAGCGLLLIAALVDAVALH